MDPHKKLAFVQAMTKMGLQHFDSGGGVISAGNSNPLEGISGALTAQNSFNASAPTQAGVVGQQQATLAGQLQNEAAGSGPNPAQIQYQQNAQQIAQNAATTNSQNRALNPGLAARLSGNQAVAAGQVSAGTAAAQQAEQQLAAQQQMEGLTGQEQTGALSAQAINAQTAQNNANSVNQTQGGILSSVPLVGGLFAGLSKGGFVGRSLTPVKLANGGLLQEAAQLAPLAMMAMSHGGDVGSSNDSDSSSSDKSGNKKDSAPMFTPAPGAIYSPYAPNFSNAAFTATPKQFFGPGEPQSGVGKYLQDTTPGALGNAANNYATASNNFGANGTPASATNFGSTPLASPIMGGQFNSGAPTLGASIGSSALSSGPSLGAAMAFSRGGAASAIPVSFSSPIDLMKNGGSVRAANSKEKAKVRGDSLKNDKIPAFLSEGEIVIPRHITQGAMAPEKTAAFVRAVLAKRGFSPRRLAKA